MTDAGIAVNQLDYVTAAFVPLKTNRFTDMEIAKSANTHSLQLHSMNQLELSCESDRLTLVARSAIGLRCFTN